MIWLYTLALISGFILLAFGAEWLVRGSVRIARKFNVSQMIIGLTIVSLGTSMPELLISILAAVQDRPDLVLGNIVGSNISNIMLILGLSGLLTKHALSMARTAFDITFSIIGVLLLALFASSGVIHQLEAAVFLLLFALYLGHLFFRAKGASTEFSFAEEETNTPTRGIKIILSLMGGLFGLLLGGQLSVFGASNIALTLGMSEKLVGLTILAIGSSLPELITCLIAVRKASSDLAVGNIIGSNILNIYFILGTTALISPIQYNFTFGIDFVVIGVTSLALLFFMIIGQKQHLTRSKSTTLFIGYIIYIAYSIMSS